MDNYLFNNNITNSVKTIYFLLFIVVILLILICFYINYNIRKINKLNTIQNAVNSKHIIKNVLSKIKNIDHKVYSLNVGFNKLKINKINQDKKEKSKIKPQLKPKVSKLDLANQQYKRNLVKRRHEIKTETLNGYNYED